MNMYITLWWPVGREVPERFGFWKGWFVQGRRVNTSIKDDHDGLETIKRKLERQKLAKEGHPVERALTSRKVKSLDEVEALLNELENQPDETPDAVSVTFESVACEIGGAFNCLSEASYVVMMRPEALDSSFSFFLRAGKLLTVGNLISYERSVQPALEVRIVPQGGRYDAEKVITLLRICQGMFYRPGKIDFFTHKQVSKARKLHAGWRKKVDAGQTPTGKYVGADARIQRMISYELARHRLAG